MQRWFGHVERMEYYRLVKIVRSSVGGVNLQSRSHKRFIGNVRTAILREGGTTH